MVLSRREFLETGSITILSASLTRVSALAQPASDDSQPATTEIPIVWMATGSCTGCSVSLLNAASPTVRFVLVGNVLPDRRLSLAFHSTLMASGGDMAIDALERVARERARQYVLVVDGATAAKDDGRYCSIGEIGGRPITGYEHVRDLGRDAMLVLAVGACAAFGGIPAAAPNPTGCLSVADLFARDGIETPVVRIPGCPPHPDWIVGTIATLLLGGVEGLKLDELGRPAAYFSQLIHDNCPYRGHFDRGAFAEHFGEHGCLIKLGCKGPITQADCPIRKFNNGRSWCCQCGHPCIGCCHPEFPFEQTLFAPIEASQLGFPAAYPPTALPGRKRADADTYATVGMIGLGGFLAGVGVTAAVKRLTGESAPAAVSASDLHEE